MLNDSFISQTLTSRQKDLLSLLVKLSEHFKSCFGFELIAKEMVNGVFKKHSLSYIDIIDKNKISLIICQFYK